ncbi:MAG: hypothetical protein CVV22_11190 [Ignavibacteriae bacterium HGW-Ignavibacteriae-1]|jgi:WD40 repeat protein/uncharacterized protein YegL|nr:MAG: hypothetical protein CVV22_11190 [Ignavibacteriae bacterium HGW-Ignavibacteriae-1]
MKTPIKIQSFFAVALLFLALCVNQSSGQSLSLFDLDISNFPTIKAKFYAFDADGKQILNLSPSDFELMENGLKRTVTNVSCPTPAPPIAISSVLTIDVSGSMSGRGIANAKAASRAWVEGLPLGKSECAITAFDHLNYIIQDFTSDISKLLDGIDNLNAKGGTDYDVALINPLAGGLLVTQNAKFKRVIVFITDGKPNREPQTSKIIQEALSQDVVIYGVTLNMLCPQNIKDITTQTGGQWFENVTTIDEAVEVYRKILQEAQGGEPCEIEWESGAPCIEGITDAELKISDLGLKVKTSYQSPIASVANLEFDPLTVKFLNPVIGIKVEEKVRVTARNADFTVSNITGNNTAFTITPTNFILNKGESRELTISYTPSDSSYNFCKFEIESAPCTMQYYAVGGYRGIKPKIQTLKLTHPNGGETFVVGNDTLITWEGVLPDEKVHLEYSTNYGQNWQTITKNASGLAYNWTNIPKPASNQCLVRVSQGGVKNDSNESKYLEFSLEHSERVNNAIWSPNGDMILTVSDDFSAIIWDSWNGLPLLTLKYTYNKIINGAWSPDGKLVATITEDRYGSPGNATIWNVENGEKLSEIYNTGTFLKWSPDGARIVSQITRVIIWDPFTGKELVHFKNYLDFDFAFWNNDGTKILVSSYIGKGGVYSAVDGTLLIGWSDYPSATYVIKYADWSPDGTKFLSTTKFYSTSRYNKISIHNSIGGGVYKELPDTNIHFNKAVWNNDGSQILGLGYLQAYVWDVNNSQLLYTLEGHNSHVFDGAWSPDNKYFVTSGNHAIVWDANSGKKLIELFSNQEIPWNYSSWSPDSKRILTAGSDKKARVWRLESNDEFPQSDVSDAVFSIVEPIALSRDIDMLQVLLGTTKDSVVSDFIMNIGTWKFRVDSIYIQGADASAFSLVSGFPEYTIESNKSHFAEFSFVPNRVGLHTAEIVIITQSDTLKQSIIGEGVEPHLQIINNLIDFGTVPYQSQKDSISAQTIKNVSSSPITITSTKHNYPNIVDFSTINGGGSFTLQPGETHLMDLRFAPSSLGRTSGTLEFHYDGVGSPAIVQLFGNGQLEPKIVSFSPLCVGDLLYLFTNEVHKGQYHWMGPNGFTSDQQYIVIPNAQLHHSGRYSLYIEIEGAMTDTTHFDVLVNENIVTPNDENLVFLGNTKRDDLHIELTEATVFNSGAVWMKEKFSFKKDFFTEFKFNYTLGDNGNMEETSLPGADGLAFVIQNEFNPALGEKGGDIGYTGFKNSMAIEIDLFRNPYDPNGNHIAIQSLGPEPNTADHSIKESTLAMNKNIMLLEQDSVYYVRIAYNYALRRLNIYLNNERMFTEPVLTLNDIDLPEYLSLEDGEFGYVGFTSATGRAFQVHNIYDWIVPCKNSPLSVYDTPKSNQGIVRISPNPANNILEVDLQLNEVGQTELLIYNMQGEKVKELLKQSISSLGAKNLNSDISELSSGQYYLVLITPTYITTKNLIIMR